ncbi:sulfotransferase [candidate division KSB1 bacterium]|nr:sulfotransferase [candidate division KSB1 bacterium]
MSILIGGPGSTGSSLLRTVLNRHPELYSGAELGFFNKEPVFTDWKRIRSHLLTQLGKRMTTHGWFPYAAHNLLHTDYGWSRTELDDLLRGSESVVEFAASFFERPLQHRNAKIWIEKTPSNAYCFQHFLNLFENGKVVHITRNPLDAVASMVNRGMTPYFAAGNWVYNNAAALSAAYDTRYHRITYETMVQDPEKTLHKLTDFIDISFHTEIFDPREDEENQPSGIASWTYARTGRIVNPKKSTFEISQKYIQNQIVTALSAFRIHPRHMKKYGFKQTKCNEVCEALGYEFRPEILLPAQIRFQQVRDISRRTFRLYATHWPNQPGSLCFINQTDPIN